MHHGVQRHQRQRYVTHIQPARYAWVSRRVTTPARSEVRHHRARYHTAYRTIRIHGPARLVRHIPPVNKVVYRTYPVTVHGLHHGRRGYRRHGAGRHHAHHGRYGGHGRHGRYGHHRSVNHHAPIAYETVKYVEQVQRQQVIITAFAPRYKTIVHRRLTSPAWRENRVIPRRTRWRRERILVSPERRIRQAVPVRIRPIHRQPARANGMWRRLPPHAC
jgi:hypothetical protein